MIKDDFFTDFMERLSVHDPNDKSGALAALRLREKKDGCSYWPEVVRCFYCVRNRPPAVGLTNKDRRWRGPNYLKRAVLRCPGRGAYIPDEAFRVAAIAAGMTRKGDTFLVRGEFWLLDPGEV